MSTDYYTVARQVSELLNVAGYNEQSRALVDAIEQGATATEILMGLRYHLAIAMELDDLDEELRLRICQLHREINVALNR